MKKHIKKLLLLGGLLILLSIFLVHTIDDKLVFSKKGKLIKLSTVSSILDFFYKPVITKSKLKINSYKLEKVNPGISSDGVLENKKEKFKCKLLHIPKINNPYFEIKILEDNSIGRKTRVKLYPFEKAFLAPFYGSLISEKLGLIHQKYELIFLDFRSIKHPYILREKYNSGLIEKQNISNGIHFKIEKISENYNDGYEIVMINNKSHKIRRFIYNKIEQLNKKIINNNFNTINEIFDLEYLSRYYIFCHLTGKKSLSETRWVYRLTDGKIYPIATSHNSFKKIKKNESIWNFFSKNQKFNFYILKNLNKSDFPNNKELNQIEEEYNSIFCHYKESAKLSQRELNYLLKKDKQILNKNLGALFKKNIHYDDLINYPLNHDLIDTIISKLGFYREGNKILIKSGNYQLNNSIVIPRGYNLSIDTGTILKLNNSVNFIVNGTININGTPSKKVIIKSVNDVPFGVFGSVGNNTDTSYIENLEIINGSEAYIDGKFFSGALSLYHQNVILKNSSFFNNKADDGLNIKYGNIIIENSVFYNNWADQVDIDFCNGVINNCSFNCDKGDSNGDGLDLSGSNVTITNSTFNNFNDKGLSIGEKSIASLSSSRFTNNLNATSIKDLSELHAFNNYFNNNNTAFNLYRKKLIFGGGFLKEYNNTFKDNQTLIIKDSLSNVISN